jgi:hypothetical protein
MRRISDLGGLSAGKIDREAHAPTAWDKRVDAMFVLLGKARCFRVDEHRRAIEALPEERYHRLRYYEKWLLGLRALAVEKGLVSETELAARMDALEGRQS